VEQILHWSKSVNIIPYYRTSLTCTNQGLNPTKHFGVAYTGSNRSGYLSYCTGLNLSVVLCTLNTCFSGLDELIGKQITTWFKNFFN